jgi:hypothetical protein
MSCIERIPLKKPCMVSSTLLHHHPQSSVALKRNNTENSKQILPEKEFHGHSPNFNIHVSVRDLHTVFPRSICLFCCRKICGPIQEIYESLTDTWMWK